MTGYLPVCFKVSGKKILLIGGGRVALHKLQTLLQYEAQLVVAAVQIDPSIRDMPVKLIEAAYDASLLRAEDYALLYACTNNRETNRQIAEDARRIRLPVNVVDDPALSDFISPAIYRQGNMAVAVSSDGTDVKRSVAWRDRIREVFDADV